VNSAKLRNVAVGVLVVGLAGAALASQVTFPQGFPFAPNTPIRAADVNAAFYAVQSAVDDNHARLVTVENAAGSAAFTLAALEARIAALEATAVKQSYYAEQTGTDANGEVNDVWVDVPGISIPVTLNSQRNIRYQLFARMYNWNATPGNLTSCSVRIVKDNANTVLIPPAFPATLGDWNSVFVGGDSSASNGQQVALSGLVSLPAGTYNFKVQVVRNGMPPPGINNSGNCQISRWSFSRARFFIDVVP
jgi:hypothetical protein